jgi:hypothetical protein
MTMAFDGTTRAMSPFVSSSTDRRTPAQSITLARTIGMSDALRNRLLIPSRLHAGSRPPGRKRIDGDMTFP